MRNRQHKPGFGRSEQTRPKPASPGIRPALFYAMFAVLLGTNVLTGVGLMMSADIARLLSGQSEQAAIAYEDRIAQLRVEVDRLHSRQYAQAGDINLQLQELSVQQEILSEQHQYVKVLADKAVELGIQPAALAAARDATMTTGSIAPAELPAFNDIETAGHAVRQMMDETRIALDAISTAATESTDQIMAELRAIGIKPTMPEVAGDGVGGPLLPARDDLPDATDMLEDANAVMSALIRFKAARGAIDAAPVHMPVTGKLRLSSNFGNRKDPFTGRSAFHSGVDFAQPSGTIVLAAGGGKVSYVGQRSGYGNVVEIDHGGGLITRYAHLSGFIAKEGQWVTTGTPIAKVGSTGRSTGPHLHFEVRRNDQAIDPSRFLAAGKRIRQILALA